MSYTNLLNSSIKDITAIYSRVSTAQQDIKKQINMAEAYLRNKKIDIANVRWFNDDDVSANKLTIEQRPALAELLNLVKQGRVKTIVAYGRDRLARNFYEYTYIIKIFKDYEVNIVFTSNKQPAYSEQLTIESIYGIFAQNEGQGIVGRTNDSNKQFPANIFGYIKSGNKKNARYSPNPRTQSSIRLFFQKVKETKSVPVLIEVLLEFKSLLNKDIEDLVSYLRKPFYCGRMAAGDGYEILNHVIPITTLEDFIEVQKVLKQSEKEITRAVMLSNYRGPLTPTCFYCKSKMNYRSSKSDVMGYYVCRKKHRRVKIEIEEFEKLISKNISYVTKKIPLAKIEKDIRKTLHTLEKKYRSEEKSLSKKMENLQWEIVNLIGESNDRKLESIIKQKSLLKKKIKNNAIRIAKITESLNGINTFAKQIKNEISNEIEEMDINYLCHILIDGIEISENEILFNVRFGEYLEGSVI